MHDPLNKIFIVNDGCSSYAECPTLEDATIFNQVKDYESDSDDESEQNDEYGSEEGDPNAN